MSALALPAAVRALWAPPPRLRPSEWAARYRHLPESSAARGALWSNTTQPALVGIMDAVVEPGVREVAVVKAAQGGGSEAIANIIGYHIHLAPCPILLAHPTYDSVTEWIKETLDDVVRSTPELAARVRDRRAPRGTHQGESTLLLKRYPGGYLAGVGGNSPNAYARRSCRIVIADDAARLPAAVGEEGDPAALLRARTSTWPDSLCLFVGTPTIEDDVIDQAWKRSDQRRFHLTCPGCGHEDYVTWQDPEHFRVTYEGAEASTARLACPSCDARHDEAARVAMVRAGRWLATRTPDRPGLAGFHLPRTISLLGDATLEQLVAGWLEARKNGREALRAFVNTVLGEPWEERDTPKLEPHVLMARREDYAAEVPKEAAVITAGIDVQADRIEVQVVAWGDSFERWVIDLRTLQGDPRQRDVWAELTDALRASYLHASGRHLPIHAACIDSGFLADEVYGFVMTWRPAQGQAKELHAIKGESHGMGTEPLVMKVSRREFGRDARPVHLQRLNVDAGKAELSAALNKAPGGPSTVHFGPFLGEPYFVQLTAERLERHYTHGVARERWVKEEGARNEAWDTLIYARAAFDIVSRGRHDMALRQVRETLTDGKDAQAEPKKPEPAPAATPAPGFLGPRRRGWLK